MIRFILLFYLFIVVSVSQAQVINSIDTTLDLNSSTNILVSSNRSYENSLELHANYFPYISPQFTNYYSTYYPFIELLKEISFTNTHNKIIPNFYFTINDQVSNNIDTLIKNIFDSTNTEKSNAINLYNYVAKNHLYHFAPDILDPINENYNASKFLNVYGFGHCGMIASTVAQIAAKYTANDQRFWYIDGGSHGLAEIKIDSNYFCIDADQQSYYLLPDNKSLASFQDIYFDKYLYLRSKHFGITPPFEIEWNKHFYNYIKSPFNFINHTDSTLNIIEPCCNRINTLIGENKLDFNLLPNSKISFFPSDTLFLNHYVQTNPIPSYNTVLNNIGKGSYYTNYKPYTNQISNAIYYNENLDISYNDSSYKSEIKGLNSTILLKQLSPYVITNGSFKIKLEKSSVLDSMNIFFSKDSITWIPLLYNSVIDTGISSFNLDLNNLILTNSSKATYEFYIKINFRSKASYPGIKIIKLETTFDFQYNKLTGPKFKNGINNIKIYADDTSNVISKIKWEEINNNSQPNANISTIFPPNNTTIDSNFFTFKWTIPTDPDGDSIVNYQIQVSDQPDMKYPIAPLFDRVLKLTNGGLPQFTPEIKDYLNPNQEYYWHVKAQDNNGLWSNWSNTMNFKVKGPLYPQNVHWEFAPDSATEIIKLKWDYNINGDSVKYYKIYGSNEMNGFYPNDSNQIAVSIKPEYLFHLNNIHNQYRIKSFDYKDNESSSSYFVNIPFFYTAILGQSFDYIGSIQSYLNLQLQPWPNVNIQDRSLFCIYDTNYFTKNNTQLTPINIGFSKVDLCTKIGNDTIYVYQLFLKVLPVGSIENYHTKPSLLVTPADTIVNSQNNLVLTNNNYIGFIDNDDTSDLLNVPFIINSVNSNTTNGIYESTSLGGVSNKYNIVYQNGLIFVNHLNVSKIEDNFKTKTNIYPNPANHLVIIDVNSRFLNGTIQINSAVGKLIFTSKINNNKIKIDTRNLQNGLYFIKINDSKKLNSVTDKILILH